MLPNRKIETKLSSQNTTDGTERDGTNARIVVKSNSSFHSNEIINRSELHCTLYDQMIQ